MKTEPVLGYLTINNKIYKTLAVLIYLAVLILLIFGLYSEKVNRNLSGNMIRMHIVANSDSKTDQDIKYLIRDEIVNHMIKKTDELKSKEDAGAYIQNNTEELKTIANRVIADSGLTYTAEVSYGKYPFPSKDITTSFFRPGIMIL